MQSRYYNPGLCRFNAPDAFASTGQGILGNNMFAYCRNNPVNNADYTGTAGLPIPTLSDYYGMHKAVQYDIAEERGYGIEVPVIGSKGVGRLDLYDGTTNTYYEVKHFLAAQNSATEDQMAKYDSSHVTGWRFLEYQFGDNVTRGTVLFSGSTEYLYWDITYKSNGDGLVIYRWQLNEYRYAQYIATAAITITAAAYGYASGGAAKGARRVRIQ